MSRFQEKKGNGDIRHRRIRFHGSREIELASMQGVRNGNGVIKQEYTE